MKMSIQRTPAAPPTTTALAARPKTLARVHAAVTGSWGRLQSSAFAGTVLGYANVMGGKNGSHGINGTGDPSSFSLDNILRYGMPTVAVGAAVYLCFKAVTTLRRLTWVPAEARGALSGFERSLAQFIAKKTGQADTELAVSTDIAPEVAQEIRKTLTSSPHNREIVRALGVINGCERASRENAEQMAAAPKESLDLGGRELVYESQTVRAAIDTLTRCMPHGDTYTPARLDLYDAIARGHALLGESVKALGAYKEIISCCNKYARGTVHTHRDDGAIFNYYVTRAERAGVAIADLVMGHTGKCSLTFEALRSLQGSIDEGLRYQFTNDSRKIALTAARTTITEKMQAVATHWLANAATDAKVAQGLGKKSRNYGKGEVQAMFPAWTPWLYYVGEKNAVRIAVDLQDDFSGSIFALHSQLQKIAATRQRRDFLDQFAPYLSSRGEGAAVWNRVATYLDIDATFQLSESDALLTREELVQACDDAIAAAETKMLASSSLAGFVAANFIPLLHAAAHVTGEHENFRDGIVEFLRHVARQHALFAPTLRQMLADHTAINPALVASILAELDKPVVVEPTAGTVTAPAAEDASA